MTVNLVKLCVGADNIDDLEAWVKKRSLANKREGRGRYYEHVTRMFPRRRDELLNGGSLYWVIKGMILARQKLSGFDKRLGADGIERCAIIMHSQVILTNPQPRRAFQGWRYLNTADAPADLDERSQAGRPPELSVELAELGLL